MDINKIKNIKAINFGVPDFEMIIKNNVGEVVYQNKSFGGIVASVEKINKFTGLEMEGQHQIFGWGNILTQWYALDHINKFFMEKGDEFVDEMVDIGVLKGDTKTIQMLKDGFKKYK